MLRISIQSREERKTLLQKEINTFLGEILHGKIHVHICDTKSFLLLFFITGTNIFKLTHAVMTFATVYNSELFSSSLYNMELTQNRFVRSAIKTTCNVEIMHYK